MSDLQKKIYDYFNRNAELRVLFIFSDAVDMYATAELEGAEWMAGYRYVNFKGDWFTTKYRLDNDWKDEKVVIYCDQASPMKVKSTQASFPLMDVLAANMEYQSQDYAAFMQQYGLLQNDPKLVRFVERNVVALQSTKMRDMLLPYYQDGSITHDLMVRGFISSFLQAKNVLDWDNIVLRLLLNGRSSERKKQTNFYVKLRTAKEVAEVLTQHLTDVFGVAYNDNTEEKVAQMVRVMKYNAIVQNLAPVEADNYRQTRITDAVALQHMNRILELALSNEKTTRALTELFAELGGDVRDADLIRWYGTDANYYYVPEALCLPIIATLLKEKMETEPAAVGRRIEELMIKHNDNGMMAAVMEYAMLVARLYDKALNLGSLTLNTPMEYVARYEADYSQIDQLYRQAIETYFKIDPGCELFEVVQQVKRRLDQNYSKLSHCINHEWTRCLKEAGGLAELNILRQQDFYDEKVKPVQKKVAVIVSDAMRYEVAQELIGELAKSRHTATLKPALAMMPSETKYCKPALLPHAHLTLNGQGEEQNLAVDNRILDTTQKRSEHLQAYREGAICVPYETVAAYDRDKNREIFKHSLVYIFHDAIDQAGHDGTARQIAESCRTAIRDLAKMISAIHTSYNVTEVVVTSDHGFLFNDIDFAEKDKVKISEACLERSSRYYLTQSTDEVAGVAKFKLSEVSGMDNADGVMVAVPEGTNRFAAPAGGYRFTHGGAALQEIIIPVITSRQERADNKQPVGVMMLNRNLSVQASRLRFNLIQMEAVSMEMKERRIKVAIYHNDVPVTAVKEIVLDKTDTSLDNRKVLVDLTLNRNVDAKVLQLKIYDSNDDLNPIIKENVTNNTLIENDFDF